MWKKVVLYSALIIGLMIALHAQQTAVAQTGLVNPSFEEPYNNGVANGWAPWHEDTSTKPDCNSERYAAQPKWSPEFNPALILDSARSMHVGNQFDTWHGGVFQTVSAVPGETYRFSVWAWGRGTNAQYPEPSDFAVNMRVRVGIDPTGQGLWTSPNIVWSGAISPHDNWQQVVVEVVAQSDKISVYTEGDFTGLGQCRAHLDIWFDKAELTTTGPAPTNTAAPLPTLPPQPVQPVAPAATATPIPSPTPVPTETPIPSPTFTPTPVGGSICVNTFNDANGDGANNDNAGYMAGVRYVVAQNNAPVGDGISSGTNNPVCFDNLVAGEYQVAQFLPDALEMTTAGNISLNVNAGDSIGLDFGSRLKQNSAPVIDNSGSATEVAVNTTPAVSNQDTTTTGGAVVEATNPDDGVGGIPGLGLWEIAALAIMGIAVLLLGIVVVLLLRQQGPRA